MKDPRPREASLRWLFAWARAHRWWANWFKRRPFGRGRRHCRFLVVFPESVWAKGSSNKGGLSNIFTSSHLHITSWNLHTFSSSHPHIFTSSYLHIFSPAHPHIFTSSHLHILTSSSSHLLIFTSSHLHMFSSSHLLIFTSVEVRSPKTKVKLWFHASGRNPFARNEVRSPKTEVKLWFWFALVRAQPFRTKRGSIANWGKIAISQVRSQPAVFTEWGSIAKNWSKIAILKPPAQV